MYCIRGTDTIGTALELNQLRLILINRRFIMGLRKGERGLEGFWDT